MKIKVSRENLGLLWGQLTSSPFWGWIDQKRSRSSSSG